MLIPDCPLGEITSLGAKPRATKASQVGLGHDALLALLALMEILEL